jgi:hypothetical protein
MPGRSPVPSEQMRSDRGLAPYLAFSEDRTHVRRQIQPPRLFPCAAVLNGPQHFEIFCSLARILFAFRIIKLKKGVLL